MSNPTRKILTKDEILTLAPTVGAFMIAFGGIDVMLARLTELVYPMCQAEGVQIKRSRTLSGKLSGLKKAFNKVESLRHVSSRAKSIFEAIDRITPTRHLLTHGSLDLYESNDVELVFSKVNPSPDGASQYEEKLAISKVDLRQEAASAMRAYSEMNLLVFEIVTP